MDRTTRHTRFGKEAEPESEKVEDPGSGQRNGASREQRRPQPEKKFRLAAIERLGIAFVALVTFWSCDLPPDDPVEWFSWLYDTAWEMELLLLLIFALVTRAVWRYKRQGLSGFYPGAVAVRGVSIVEFKPESIAQNAGMHKGDVIIEYASERDLTVEKLSAVVARKKAERGPVWVAFMRDRQKLLQTIPCGPLGISATNTTVSVPLKPGELMDAKQCFKNNTEAQAFLQHEQMQAVELARTLRWCPQIDSH